jgi:16S rRNA (uracil1498-N3)-methyltransferase
MLARFLATHLDPDAASAWLNAEEAHHLTHVLRLRTGDEVAVFDGAGREFRARIDGTGRGGAELTLLEEIPAAAEPRVRITLGQAVLKPDGMDAVVRDATMMGVAAIQPLVTMHAAVPRRATSRDRGLTRWQRIAIASSKQCRRAVVPTIESASDFSEWIRSHVADQRLMLVEPTAATTGAGAAALEGHAPSSAALVVGPEGGWAPEEIAFAVEAGWTLLTLGRRTLRADAAAAIAIGILQCTWKDL